MDDTPCAGLFIFKVKQKKANKQGKLSYKESFPKNE